MILADIESVGTVVGHVLFYVLFVALIVVSFRAGLRRERAGKRWGWPLIMVGIVLIFALLSSLLGSPGS